MSRRWSTEAGRERVLASERIKTGDGGDRGLARSWASLADAVAPDAVALAGLAAIVGVAAALAAIGAWAAGRRRAAEIDLILGWGVIAAAFTLAGAVGLVAFTWVAVAALLAAVVATAAVRRRDGRLWSPGTLRLVALALPLLVLVAGMAPTQWDELRHWLPNARYLFEHDGFPATDRPASASAFPGYPHGLAFVGYLASRLAGRFVETAGALFNILLLLAFASLLVRIVREALAGDPRRLGGAMLERPRDEPGWGWCAIGALAVTALNPTFVAKIVLSAYGETGTAVALATGVALAWFALNALAAGDRAAAARHAWTLGLAASALVSVKQANLVLFAGLLAGVALVAARDPRIKARELLRLAPAALLLPLAVYAAWRIHLAVALPGSDFPVRPFSQWSIALIPEISARMALIASKKGGYFLLMLVAGGFAVRALIRTRDPFDRLALLTGTVFAVYTAFLLFGYVALFGEYEGARAASYWRYNMHLGLVGLLFAAYGVARLVGDRRGASRAWRGARAAGFAAAAVVVVLPIAAAEKLRFDLAPDYRYIRGVAADMSRRLRPEHRLITVDPVDNGQFMVLLHYGLHGSAQVAGEITAFDRGYPRIVGEIVAARNATHLWLRRPDAAVVEVHGLALAPGSSYLLARRDGRWTVAGAWPEAGGDPARVLPD
jgi:hypothetical protein